MSIISASNKQINFQGQTLPNALADSFGRNPSKTLYVTNLIPHLLSDHIHHYWIGNDSIINKPKIKYNADSTDLNLKRNR